MIEKYKVFSQHTLVGKNPMTVCRLMGSRAFDYPFFNDGALKSVRENIIGNHFKLSEINSECQDLLEIKGFIYHTSRCGSTLLSRMFGECSKIRVVSETEAINGLLLSYLLFNLPKELILKRLKDVIEAYRQPLNDEKYLIFKLSSWNVFFVDLFQNLYPDQKWIYIDRKTEEVVDSLSKSKGGLGEWWNHPVGVLRDYFIGEGFPCKGKKEYLTRIVAQHRNQAERFENKNLCKLMYPRLLNQFEEIILPHFGLKFNREDIKKSIALMAFDSKSITKKIFIPDK